MSMFERDFFTDPEIFRDPSLYYAELHDLGPVVQEPHKSVFMISGMKEILSVFADHDSFSAIVAPAGPFLELPALADGERVSDIVTKRRSEVPFSDQLITMDPPGHTRSRSLLTKLFTPNRLKENEEFMWSLADGLIDEFQEKGEVEIVEAYANPFTLLVVADLLGVPREDHATLRGWIEGDGEKKNMAGDPEAGQTGHQVLARLYPYFIRYVEERRASPGDDTLSQLANVRFPDGELPEAIEIVKIAVILFAAGQETTARLVSTGMRILAEQPALADELRGSPDAIPNFVEECLRFESPIKGTFRLVLRDTQLGGVELPEGSIVMAMTGAANLDRRVFQDADRFDPKRTNGRRNIAFGHGEHFCPGASLARAEARVSFERLLTRLDDIRLAKPDELSYAPSFLIRGLDELPLLFRSPS